MKPKLEFITRNLSEHTVIVGHVVTKDLHSPVMSMGEVSIKKEMSEGTDTYINVTISKSTKADIRDSYGYSLSKSEDMTMIPKLPIWRGSTLKFDDTLLGNYVVLDTFHTKEESESEVFSMYNRCLFTSVLENTIDTSCGREHLHWETISSYESEHCYQFRMKAVETSDPLHILYREGELLDEHLKGEGLCGILRLPLWRDMKGEHFAFRWFVNKDVVTTLNKMRKHTVNNTTPSKGLLDKVEELNIRHLCCSSHPNPEYIEYLKFVHGESPKIDADEVDFFLPNITMLRMIDSRTKMFFKSRK
ncbi:hypothetical protein [Vibrio sp. D431a]|uniref:hypothetical protein n=1 Tax=Vibrio sp. D431a TaxID=2837388 RepID=UPI0025525E1F|nr:hypothetical protein [Vibrio sp. D431a]MDK9793794.1 hypothetical protein [Vibrio sp. D431a]